MADGESFMALVWPVALGKGIERAATGRATGWRADLGGEWQPARVRSNDWARARSTTAGLGSGDGRGGSESARTAGS